MTGVIIFTVGLMVGGSFGFAVAAFLQAASRDEDWYLIAEEEQYGNEKANIKGNQDPRP